MMPLGYCRGVFYQLKLNRMVHINSIEAYGKIIEKLPTKRRQVFDTILNASNGLTLEQIADRLGTLPYKISGRITELKESGLVVPVRKGTTADGNTCDVYGVPNHSELRQLNLF